LEGDFLKVFTIYVKGKLMTPLGGANFDPRAIILTFFVECHEVMIHTKYLSSRLCTFREEVFKVSILKIYFWPS
jgi:hypothetical protein